MFVGLRAGALPGLRPAFARHQPLVKTSPYSPNTPDSHKTARRNRISFSVDEKETIGRPSNRGSRTHPPTKWRMPGSSLELGFWRLELRPAFFAIHLPT